MPANAEHAQLLSARLAMLVAAPAEQAHPVRAPRREDKVLHRPVGFAAALAAALVLVASPASAQKPGGTLRMYLWDNPPSASIHEEATVSTVMPFMALFNNLVLYDQAKQLNTMDAIEPELATSWAWNDDGTRLTFALRRDVIWHDGKIGR